MQVSKYIDQNILFTINTKEKYMTNAFCTKCGAGLAPGSSFCASCGAQAETAPQAQPACNAAPQPGAAYLKPRGRLSKGAILGIIGAAVVITGVILLIVLLGGGGDASVKIADICGEWSGYVKIEKTFKGKLPLTICKLTASGRRAFEQYRQRLQQFIAQTAK
jgi:hypothetical protein